ncbi:hypothetical protein APHAL10511_006659 [Amanita phalloides]|nr:hypothetical protein APHAL10511_006659 [Amanita phalloides]
MYKFSVAFFVLLLSMTTTFVAAAPDGTRQPVSFWRRADGYQQPVNAIRLRKRDPTQAKIVLAYCSHYSRQCNYVLGKDLTLNQLAQGDVHRGTADERYSRLSTIRAAHTWCHNNLAECRKAVL